MALLVRHARIGGGWSLLTPEATATGAIDTTTSQYALNGNGEHKFSSSTGRSDHAGAEHEGIPLPLIQRQLCTRTSPQPARTRKASP
jgi:hypothetical protein